MTQISIEQIQKELPFYLTMVKRGETVIIEDSGEPVAELRPMLHRGDDIQLDNKRPVGLGKGDFVVPDDFNEPLPEHVIEEFER